MDQLNPGKGRPAATPGSRLPTLAQSLAFAVWPTELSERWRRRFGDLFTIKLLPTGPFAYVNDPDDARAVLAGEDSRLRAGAANQMLEPVNGADSVVVLDGEDHARARQLLLPLFRPARLAQHRTLIDRIVEREVSSWPLHRPFQLAPRMHDVALEVIVRTTLGGDEEAVKQLRRLLPALLRANTLTWLPIAGRRLGPLGPAGRLARLARSLDRILYAKIAERRALAGAAGETSLDFLLAARPQGRPLGDPELRDHLATLLLSGHETTSSSLAWAFERLIRHPRVVERLRADLLNGDEEYLEAVVKEVLRSRPAVMDTGRVLTEDLELAGRRLTKGSQLRVAIYSIQQRRDLYRQPQEFRPERFLDGEVAGRDWMPFGGGSRRCIGAALAMLEMKTVIAAVVRRAELRPVRTRAERPAFKAPHLTLSPARGTRAVLVRRLPARDE